MKRMIGCLVLAAVLVGFALYAYNFTLKVTESIENEVKLVAQHFEEEDFSKALTCAETAKQSWKDFSEKTVFVEYPETNAEITLALARIEELVRRQNDDVYIECAALLSIINNYKNSQKPYTMSLF